MVVSIDMLRSATLCVWSIKRLVIVIQSGWIALRQEALHFVPTHAESVTLQGTTPR
jgi:hypothetical protein